LRLLPLLPDLVCLAVCAVATVLDLRSRRIPNWLTVPSALGGLLLNLVVFTVAGGGLREGLRLGLLPALIGALFLLLGFGFLGLIRFVGMGDVKLMAAVGAFLRWPSAILAFAYVALAGGVIALAYAVLRGRLGPVLRNLFTLGRGVVAPRRAPARKLELHRIPYALAILLGAAWVVVARYVPALSLP